MDRNPYGKIVILVLAIAFFALNSSTVYGGLLNQSMGYVSDDIWYVSSARNMLREFWGLQPRALENGKTYVTVLAYNNESYSRTLDVLEQSGTDFSIIKADYQKSLGYGYQKALALLVSEETLTRIGEVENVQVYRGYPYPDYSGIMEYENLEHPPLVRYVLASTMLFDDRPLTWRIPSLVLGSAILVLAYLVAKRIFGELGGVVAAIFVFTEPTVRAMSMVAMLDIYLSFFTILALYFALSRKRLLTSAITIGLAGSAKMSGFFMIPAFIFSILWRRNYKILIPIGILIPALIYLVFSTPIILHMSGLNTWIKEILAAMRWFITTRPAGPPTNDPLGLLLGLNGFSISVVPSIIANPNILLSSITIPLTILLAPLAYRGSIKGIGTTIVWFWSVYFGYVLLYLAGNTSLYSFYAVQFMPLAAIIGSGVVFLIGNPTNVVEAAEFYSNSIRKAVVKLRKHPTKQPDAETKQSNKEISQ